MVAMAMSGSHRCAVVSMWSRLPHTCPGSLPRNGERQADGLAPLIVPAGPPTPVGQVSYRGRRPPVRVAIESQGDALVTGQPAVERTRPRHHGYAHDALLYDSPAQLADVAIPFLL